jgi:RHS repeat-associated protein
MNANVAPLLRLRSMVRDVNDFPTAHPASQARRNDRRRPKGPLCFLSHMRASFGARAAIVICALFLMSVAGFAQSISFVQEQQCDSRGTSVTCAFSSAVAAGDALMVVVDPANSTGSQYTLSVSDSLNGAWTQDGSGCFRSAIAQAAVFYYLNSKAGSVTVTVTSSTSTNIWSTIVEYSGIATSAPVDVATSCKYTDVQNGSTAATPSITTTNANDLILTGPAITGTGGTITVASPYTMVGSVGYNRVPIANQIVSSAGAYAGAVFTLQYGGETLGLITAFKAYAPVAVTVAPGTATLYEGQTQQFTASVTNTSNTGVTWSVSPAVGTITTSGLYTPPATSSTQQTVTVTATSQADTTKSASATVTLMPSYLITWPTPAAINAGTAISTTQLNATASVPGTFAYTPATGYVPAAGTMTLSVLFTPTDTTDYGVGADAVPLVVNGLAPIITTVAGNGTANYSGDNIPAVQAELFGPVGLTFDAAGNYYIADGYNARVRKVSIATGIITTVAGNGDVASNGDGGLATNAALGPEDVVLDSAGNLYISDGTSSTIRKVYASTGIITTIAGNGTAGYSGDGGPATSAELNQPWGLAFDSAGNLYIADSYNNRVREVIASTGMITTVAGTGAVGSPLGDGGPATAANLNHPLAVAFANGNLYIADSYDDRVREVNASTGIISTVVGGGGTYGFVGDGGLATSAFIRWPAGIAFDSAGNMYVSDGANPAKIYPYFYPYNRVRKISASTGIITTVAGATGEVGNPTNSLDLGDGGPASSADVSGPTGLALDSHGNLYIADAGDNRIREIVNSGAQVTWPTPAPITSGTALSSTQLDATANMAGTFVYSPAAGTVLATGVQTLSVTFTPTDSSEYGPVTATVQLVVGNVADSGTISLTVNGVTAATTTYGAGSTPESVAAGLAAGVTSNSPVNLSYVGDALSMVSKTPGSSTDYAYTLQTTSYDTQAFSQPSFMNPSISGNLDGGANSGTSSGQPVYEYGLSYYPNSNVETYSDSPPTPGIMGTWVFNYDNLNRLAGAQDSEPGSSFTNYCWGYDAFGNRTQQVASSTAITGGGATPCSPANPQPLTYNTNNQISNGPIVPAYDVAGDITNDGTNQYVYNADGKVCAVQAGLYDGSPVMYGYIYDAEGNRVAKGTITTMSCDPSVNGFIATANYVVDQAGNQLSEFEIDSNGNIALQHTNVYAAGSLMATYDSDGQHFYLNDWLGTRRAQTDAEGVLEQTCTSLPFGDMLSCTNSTQYPTEHHFTGKERDLESGNDYFGARYYANTIGRFLSPDPVIENALRIINPQRWNKYAYTINNPLLLTDPTGKDAAYVDFSQMAHGEGHAGILSIHSDGSATYSRFGPKDAGEPFGAGEVQTDHELPLVQFGPDGLPTVDSYAALIEAVAQFENVDPSTIGIDYFKTTEAETTALDQYIQRLQDASDAGKVPRYCVIESSCRDYALGGLVAGGAIEGWRAPFLSVVPNTLFLQLQGFADQHVDPEAGAKRRTDPPCLRDRNTGECITN